MEKAQEERDRLDRLVPVVYEELRGLAGLLLSDKAAHITLQPTSLVHEVYLRLLDQRRMDAAPRPTAGRTSSWSTWLGSPSLNSPRPAGWGWKTG